MKRNTAMKAAQGRAEGTGKVVSMREYLKEKMLRDNKPAGSGAGKAIYGYVALAARKAFYGRFYNNQSDIADDAKDELNEVFKPSEKRSVMDFNKLYSGLEVLFDYLGKLGYENPRIYIEDGEGELTRAYSESEAKTNYDKAIINGEAGRKGRDICLNFQGNNGNHGYVLLERKKYHPAVAEREKRRISQRLVGHAVKLMEFSKLKHELKMEQEKFEKLSKVDPLLGLYNAAEFQKRLRNEIYRSIKYQEGKSKVAVVAFDIDNFKVVNDTHGHAGGDDFLRDIKNIVEEEKRDADILCRVGGEEFMIIMPETDKQGAIAAAERIRKRVEAHVFSITDKNSGKRVTVARQTIDGKPVGTISMGIAVFSDDIKNNRYHGRIDKNAEDISLLADRALYHSKGVGGGVAIDPEGRNRVSYINKGVTEVYNPDN